MLHRIGGDVDSHKDVIHHPILRTGMVFCQDLDMIDRSPSAGLSERRREGKRKFTTKVLLESSAPPQTCIPYSRSHLQVDRCNSLLFIVSSAALRRTIRVSSRLVAPSLPLRLPSHLGPLRPALRWTGGQAASHPLRPISVDSIRNGRFASLQGRRILSSAKMRDKVIRHRHTWRAISLRQ